MSEKINVTVCPVNCYCTGCSIEGPVTSSWLPGGPCCQLLRSKGCRATGLLLFHRACMPSPHLVTSAKISQGAEAKPQWGEPIVKPVRGLSPDS